MAEGDVKQRLAAILAADVAGYTLLMREDERATIATLREYREVFRQHIEANDGRVVDMAGDSVLAVFASTSGAVAATQGQLVERNDSISPEKRMHFRVGVNLGDIQEAKDGTVYGDGVNVAARLENLAEPGGIILSEDAYRQVRRDPNLAFADAGVHEVKNVAEPVRAYSILMAGEAPRSVPNRRRHLVAAISVLVVAIFAAIGWQTIQRPSLETASVERMAFPLPDEPSIAVLPFDNLSGDA